MDVDAPEPDFRALVQGAGDGMYALDLEGRFTFLNEAALETLGYGAEELLGRPVEDVLVQESRSVARAPCTAATGDAPTTCARRSYTGLLGLPEAYAPRQR